MLHIVIQEKDVESPDHGVGTDAGDSTYETILSD